MKTISTLITDHIDIWTAAETEKKSGRGRASGNAGSVYGIKKLRELILELAVRGKLVPQDANDEPASALLKRIQAEKAKLIAEGKIRKGQPLSSISEQEKSFHLPVGWGWVRLGQIGDWGAGATPLRSVSSYYGGKTPWFKSGELTADYIESSEETITELALKDCSLRLNQPGDVLIAMYGATIGKTAILKVPGTTNQAVCACTPNTGIFNRYLLVLLKATKSNFIGQGAGGAQPNISREKIISTIVAMPPTAEQYRIVAKVDELMALCDQLESQHSNAAEAHEKLVTHLLGTLTQSQNAEDFSANWQRIAAHFDTLFTTDTSIDALKQTLLQLAVMGKLVPQDENDEPASELLKRIQTEKTKLIAEGKIKKDKPLPPITDDEKPFELPKKWQWVRLGIVAEVTSSKRIHVNDYVSEGVPFFRSKEIGELQRGKSISTDIFISRDKYEGLKNQTGFPKVNDLMLTSVGSIGNTWLSDGREFYYKDGNITKLGASNFLSMRFIQEFIGSPFFTKQVTDSVSGTAYNALTIIKLNTLALPLPPLAEQHRIVAKVDELMVMCDQLKTRLSNASQLQQKLADVLVEQAVA